MTTTTPAPAETFAPGTPVRYRLPWVPGWIDGTHTGVTETRPHMVDFHLIEQSDGTTVRASIVRER